MAPRTQLRLLRALQQSTPLRTPCQSRTRTYLSQRPYSTANDAPPPPPPYLQKLKGSLKDAMRAKDQARLSVLRAIMATNLNASKTSRPIATDAQLVTLLMGMKRTADGNIAEARKAGREDLVASEQTQGSIIEEYIGASGLEVLGEETLRPMIAAEVEATLASGRPLKSVMGKVMKRVNETAGNKLVDNTLVALLVQELIQEKTKKA